MSATAQALIAQYAAQYGVPLQISQGVARRESGMNLNAPDGAAGEIGMYQLEPSTAAQLGVDPRDPAQNAQGGNMYLAQLYAEFQDWATAVAAYNWGPGNVSRAIAALGPNWLSEAPSSTQSYVFSVTGVTAAQEASIYGTVPETGLVPAPPVDDSIDVSDNADLESLAMPAFNPLIAAGVLLGGAAVLSLARRI